MAVGKSNDPRANRYSRVGSRKSQAPKATWEDAEADTLWRAIDEVTRRGDALMFSLTRDGGAVVLTVMSGDDRIKSYATGPEEIAALLADVRAAAEED